MYTAFFNPSTVPVSYTVCVHVYMFSIIDGTLTYSCSSGNATVRCKIFMVTIATELCTSLYISLCPSIYIISSGVLSVNNECFVVNEM